MTPTGTIIHLLSVPLGGCFLFGDGFWLGGDLDHVYTNIVILMFLCSDDLLYFFRSSKKSEIR